MTRVEIVHLWYRDSLVTHKMISDFYNASEIFNLFLNWVLLYIPGLQTNMYITKTNNYIIRFGNKYNAEKIIWKQSIKERKKNRCSNTKMKAFFLQAQHKIKEDYRTEYVNLKATEQVCCCCCFFLF